MNVLQISKRHLAAILTIVVALGMLVVSTAHAREHNTQPYKPQSLAVAPMNDTVFISIQGFAFSPNDIQIIIGSTVTWTNFDSFPHTSSSPTLEWDSGNLSQNQSFSHTFNSTGVFNYRCNIHLSMTGAIRVILPPTATPTATSTYTPTPIPPDSDTIGIYRDGIFYLRNSNTAGFADITTAFGGDPADLPVAGDWNNDGVDTIGVYRNGLFFLSNSNTSPAATDYVFAFGNPGDTPLAGHWDSQTVGDGVGVHRDSAGIFYLKRALAGGFDDYFIVFGDPGDRAVAGDWNADGFDTVGVYKPSNQIWYLSNTNSNGIASADIIFYFYIVIGKPVTGDWNGDGIVTTGYSRDGWISLKNNHLDSSDWFSFPYGESQLDFPIAGKWILRSPPNLANVRVGQPGSNNSAPVGSGD